MITRPVSATTGQELPQDESLSAEQPAANQEELNATPPSPAESGETDSSIPEKFRGKSIEDISKSYREIEKYSGRLSSEKAHLERANEEMRQRLAQLEQQVQTISTTRAHQPQEAQEADPLSSIEDEFEQDPRAAFKKVVEHMRQVPRQLETRLTVQQQAAQASSYYAQQMKDNQDFRELEPEMKRIAREFGSMVRPEHLNSPKTIEILYKIAKAENLDRYTKSAADKAIQAKNLVREEKRAAVSESASGGTSGAAKPFEEWSLEEMERFLGRASK